MTLPTIAVETVPTAATVFPDRARVTRAGKTALATGIQRLEIRDLPMGLQPDSVRATGRGTAHARLLGVTTRLEQFAEAPAEAARELERKIDELTDADAGLGARAAVVEREVKHLDTLAAQSEMFARGLALRNRTPDEQAAIFDFISGRSRALNGELLSLGRERRDLAKEIDRLRRELQAMQSARPRQRYVAVVEVDVAQAGDLGLELTYLVRGAEWVPLYDLRLVDSTVELSYLAEVRQNTGEDWPAVLLTLSTARPSLALAIPELDPWYIGPRPPAIPKGTERARVAASIMPAPMSAPVGAAAAEARAAPPVVPEQFMAADTAAVSEAGASLTYRLSGTADVPGNNEPRKVTVASLSLRPDFTYVTAPKLEPVCYRRAEIKNDSQYSLLPGRMQLFEGDDYLGATQIEFVAPSQNFELALGADERMRVERKLAARDVDKAAILGDRRRTRYAYTIEIENLRATAQVVYVRDQLPVARDAEIKVRLDGAEPKPSEHSELGRLEWKLTLDKGTKRTIRYDFSVEYPRSMVVVGLP